MEKKYKQKMRDFQVALSEQFYSSLDDATTKENFNEKGESMGLSTSHVEETVQNMGSYSLEGQSLKQLESWFDGYFHIKEAMDTYAPNLTEHSLNLYALKNPLTLIAPHFANVNYSMDIAGSTHLLDYISTIEEDMDEHLKKILQSNLPNLIDQVYPNKHHNIEYYALPLIKSLSNDFFKEKLNFDVFQFIQNDSSKSFDFALIKEYAKNKIEEVKGSKYSVSPVIIETEKTLRDIEFSSNKIFENNLTDEEKQQCLYKLQKINKSINHLSPQEKQKNDIHFIAKLNIIPDKSNMALLNNFAKSNKLPMDNDLVAIIQAYTTKYQIEKKIKLSTVDNEQHDSNENSYKI